eukprot:8612139-Pyramimonas_sp.AAC.1
MRRRWPHHAGTEGRAYCWLKERACCWQEEGRTELIAATVFPPHASALGRLVGDLLGVELGGGGGILWLCS